MVTAAPVPNSQVSCDPFSFNVILNLSYDVTVFAVGIVRISKIYSFSV